MKKIESWLSGTVRILDIEGHDKIEPFLKAWLGWIGIFRAAVKTICYTLIFLLIVPSNPLMAISLAAAYSLINTYTSALENISNPFKAAKWLFVIGIAIGAIIGLVNNQSQEKMMEDIIRFSLSGAFFGVVLGFSVMILLLFDSVFRAVADFFNRIPLAIAKLIFKVKFPAWHGIASLSLEGVLLNNHNIGRDYVSHPSLRREGLAHKEKIPKFTQFEIKNSNFVKYRMAQWASAFPDKESLITKYPTALAAAFGTAGVASLVSVGTDLSPNDWLQDMNMVNPATGLPMMGDSMIDVNGNPFGTDFSSIDMGVTGDFSHAEYDSGGFDN